MKQPGRPTMAQKELIASKGLKPENWMVVFESRDTLEIISRRKSARRILQKDTVRGKGNDKKKM